MELSIEIKVGAEHLDQGTRHDGKKCAIALAFQESSRPPGLELDCVLNRATLAYYEEKGTSRRQEIEFEHEEPVREYVRGYDRGLPTRPAAFRLTAEMPEDGPARIRGTAGIRKENPPIA